VGIRGGRKSRPGCCAPKKAIGELHLRRAHLAAELADWRLVVEAVALALATGGLESPGSACLLSGIGHYHLQQHDEALAAFGRAQGFDASRACPPSLT